MIAEQAAAAKVFQAEKTMHLATTERLYPPLPAVAEEHEGQLVRSESLLHSESSESHDLGDVDNLPAIEISTTQMIVMRESLMSVINNNDEFLTNEQKLAIRARISKLTRTHAEMISDHVNVYKDVSQMQLMNARKHFIATEEELQKRVEELSGSNEELRIEM